MSTEPDGGFGALGGRSVRESVRAWFVTGAALTIPLLITLIVLGFVLNFVSDALGPVVELVEFAGLDRPADEMGRSTGLGERVSPVLIEAATILTLGGLILAVGIVAESQLTDGRASETFHTVIESVPGVGSVYRSFRRMGDVLVESDTDSFQEVKLVEYPHDGIYSIAFLTAETSGTIPETVGHDEMETLFVPMAPNPVMGGYVVYVSTERVYDTDMTVEEGIRSIVTSGVATGMDEAQTAVSAERMEALGFEEQSVPGPNGGVAGSSGAVSGSSGAVAGTDGDDTVRASPAPANGDRSPSSADDATGSTDAGESGRGGADAGESKTGDPDASESDAR